MPPTDIEKIDAAAIVADHRRRNAVKAARDATDATIDAQAARRLRELVPDLRTEVESQIVAAERHEHETHERAAALRVRAELADADYPDVTKDLEGRLAGLEESYVRFSEMAEAPELYQGDESVAGQADPAKFFRFQAANALASLEATRQAIATLRPPSTPASAGARRPTKTAETAPPEG